MPFAARRSSSKQARPMNRTRVLLLLALCAAGVFAWALRGPRAVAAATHATDRPRAETPSATGVAADSPNAAERLQAAGLAGVRGTAELSSMPSPEASHPGLPDFFRGA